MRKTLRLFEIVCWSAVSAGTVVAIIDWFARWNWFEQVMSDHPHFAALIRTPFAYLILLILGFLFLNADTVLKQPKVMARLVNARSFPDLHTTTMKVLFDTQAKKPGWDEEKIDYQWFLDTLWDYNNTRIHSALNMPPVVFAKLYALVA